MPVFRVEKNKDYTTISNYHLRDKRLSLKAKGLLSIMLSLPDDWDYSLEGLVSICLEKETSIKSSLKELKKYNYLYVKKYQNEKGKFEYEYNIYENPIEPDIDYPAVDIPAVEVPGLDYPAVENQGQLNTNNKILNNKVLNNKYNSPSHIAKTLFEEIENNFGRTLSPYEVEEIGKWEDTDLTRYAIKKAVLNNKFSIQYISRILYQWKMQNIRTVQEAQLQDEDFQKRKDKRKSTYKHEEIVPQWLNEEQTTEPVSESEQKEIEEVFKSLEREINED